MRRLAAALAATVLAAVAVQVIASAPAQALDDGLARTPPMGYNNWNITGCGDIFNADFVRQTADLFVSTGLKDAGYTYVNLDDCWAEPTRDTDGNLVPNHTRFPDGIKPIADYVHAKGLKFGIYTSAGTKTCNKNGGFPGGLGHEQQDASLFASWGIDYLKYDNCNNQNVDAQVRYKAMRDALKATGRPIVFSICEWGRTGPPKVWEWGADVGHLWRTTGDISDNWAKTLSIIKQNMVLAPHAGPGHWNDPDMLEVGNGHMTDTEYRTHFGLWAVMAAPLLIGTDLRKATPQTLEILTNRDVIAIDQDPLGVQGAPIRTADGLDVFVKPLANGDKAVALFNETDSPARISTSAAEVGLPSALGYKIRDLWSHTDRHTGGTIAATVPAHGTALFRVGRDNHWPLLPPAVDVATDIGLAYPGATPLAPPGTTATVTTAATNSGFIPAIAARVTLAAPPGWTATPTSPTRRLVIFQDQTFRTSWAVTVPPDTAPGKYTLTATVTYQLREASTYQLEVLVPKPPPTATVFASDTAWLRSLNGFGPVELDRSNGESKAGDGHPITIEGVVYAKGLGVHAPGTVEYYTGRRCTALTAVVGVDDEKGPIGSVVFQVFADNTKVAETPILTGAMPGVPLTADITNATTVRLVVTDAGDGNNSDHADWADTRLICT